MLLLAPDEALPALLPRLPPALPVVVELVELPLAATPGEPPTVPAPAPLAPPPALPAPLPAAKAIVLASASAAANPIVVSFIGRFLLPLQTEDKRRQVQTFPVPIITISQRKIVRFTKQTGGEIRQRSNGAIRIPSRHGCAAGRNNSRGLRTLGGTQNRPAC
jgi:hypothetical protein